MHCKRLLNKTTYFTYGRNDLQHACKWLATKSQWSISRQLSETWESTTVRKVAMLVQYACFGWFAYIFLQAQGEWSNDKGDSGITTPGIILCTSPANERWRYIVTQSLIDWVRTQTDPYKNMHGRVDLDIQNEWADWSNRINDFICLLSEIGWCLASNVLVFPTLEVTGH